MLMLVALFMLLSVLVLLVYIDFDAYLAFYNDFVSHISIMFNVVVGLGIRGVIDVGF